MCFYFLLVFFNITRFHLFYFSFGFSSILVLFYFPLVIVELQLKEVALKKVYIHI